ncbi:Transcriptional regulator of competence genes, TfoX/Sxy family [Arthrobacter sp. ok909]|uniref:TfoX/Sxy family protein n=1 Tax=Arthrobacter sp. ok909 TaxID=1761746 RepID=UPI00088E8836|nr:TfoX/Sxy family protein [Arthrobacter sp. ok909]SDP82642.1 Transcriptional regulator of competence genes, TfoX/Sxy family [Arthrobacter sp. ok909]
MLPEERFNALVEEFAASPGVSIPGEPGRRGFGSSALKVNGSIFAMISGGKLVLKLPHARVAALIGTGAGTPFDAGKGRPMKEWLTVTADDKESWLALAREALDFVGSAHR